MIPLPPDQCRGSNFAVLIYTANPVNQRLRFSWLVMPVRKGLFTFAIHDEAVFYSCLSQWSASYNSRYRIQNDIENLQYRTRGIQVLNKRFDDPIEAISDGSIVAIANIAVYEVQHLHEHWLAFTDDVG